MVGGIAGGIITSVFSARQAENQRKATSYEKRLSRRLEAIDRTTQLVRGVMASSTDIIVITGQEWNPELYPEGEERHATQAAKRKIRDRFNELDSEWRRQRESLGFVLSYYHRGSRQVEQAWSDVASAVTAYSDCARKWYLDHGGTYTDTEGACSEERAKARKKLRDLVSILATAGS